MIMGEYCVGKSICNLSSIMIFGAYCVGNHTKSYLSSIMIFWSILCR